MFGNMFLQSEFYDEEQIDDLNDEASSSQSDIEDEDYDTIAPANMIIPIEESTEDKRENLTRDLEPNSENTLGDAISKAKKKDLNKTPKDTSFKESLKRKRQELYEDDEYIYSSPKKRVEVSITSTEKRGRSANYNNKHRNLSELGKTRAETAKKK